MKKVPIISAVLLLASTSGVSAQIVTGNSSSQASVETNIQGNGNVSTHIEVNANGNTKTLDANKPRTYKLEVNSTENNQEQKPSPTPTVTPTPAEKPTSKTINTIKKNDSLNYWLNNLITELKKILGI